MAPVEFDSPSAVTIGRSSKCVVRLPRSERTVSRVHARLLALNGGWGVEDNGSTTGTYVNDEQIKAGSPCALADEDILRIGACAFLIQLDKSAEDEVDTAEMVANFAISVSKVDLATLDVTRVLRSALELPERLMEANGEEEVLHIACEYLATTMAPWISAAHVVMPGEGAKAPPEVLASYHMGEPQPDADEQAAPMLSQRVMDQLAAQPDSVVFLLRKSSDTTLGATVAEDTLCLGACLLEFSSTGRPVVLYASGDQAFSDSEELIASYLRLISTLARQHLVTLRRALLSKYFSPRVAELLIQPGTAQKTPEAPEVVDATSMFFDLHGFSLSTEDSATDLVTFHTDLLNVMSIITEEVFRYEGTVIDYQGDGMFAAWGVPFPQEDQSILAVRCAKACLSRLANADLGVFEKRRSRYFAVCGIGVARGEVVAGAIGSRKMFKYGLLGPSVNIAKRLEGLTKPDKLSAPLLLTQRVQDALAGEGLSTRWLGRVRLAGMKAVEDVYEVILSDSPREAGWGKDHGSRWDLALRNLEAAETQEDLDRLEDLVGALPSKHPRTCWLRSKVQGLRAPDKLVLWNGIHQQDKD